MTKEELVQYYIIEKHSIAECCEFFNIGKTTLCRYIKKYDCHKSLEERVQKNARTHESYIEGGKKSSKTQRDSWNSKTSDEKTAWSNKMKQCHQTSKYRAIRSKLTQDYFLTLDADTIAYRNQLRSESLKRFWENLSDEEKSLRLKKSFDGGWGWNYDTICKTNMEKYGVPNQYMRNDLNYSHMHSKPNEKFNELLIENGFDVDSIKREFPIENKSFDFKVNNNLIEINPFATHNSTWGIYGNPLDKHYHFNKSKLARDNGYRCICIWDWDSVDKILNILKNRTRIYGRDCIVKSVTKEESNRFIDENHLQGFCKDDIRLGLYYNSNLVSIMTFGKPRYNKNYEYELLRYCSSHNVIGGAEKLFNNFLKLYNPKSLISYCDYSKFNGDTYTKLGFSLDRISIGKHWYNPTKNIHITDNLLRSRGYDQLFKTNYGKGISNEQLMIDNGFVEIYDCGQATYTLSLI